MYTHKNTAKKRVLSVSVQKRTLYDGYSVLVHLLSVTRHNRNYATFMDYYTGKPTAYLDQNVLDIMVKYGYVPANSCIAYSLCLQGYRRAL